MSTRVQPPLVPLQHGPLEDSRGGGYQLDGDAAAWVTCRVRLSDDRRALKSRRFKPGKTVRLVADGDRAAVTDRRGKLTLGWVDTAASGDGVMLWEWWSALGVRSEAAVAVPA